MPNVPVADVNQNKDRFDPTGVGLAGTIPRRNDSMIRRLTLAMLCMAVIAIASQPQSAQAQEKAYGAQWGGQTAQNMDRFYHYPYVYYPQNYWGNDYYRSSESMYYRYPAEMRIPVYNRSWHNYYPTPRRYHWGHQFVSDIF